MGNPAGKQRRKRRKVSQASQSVAKSNVPSETLEKIMHLHDMEHKGFRKVADELGMTKDRVYRIYKKDAAAFKKQRQKMLSQDREYVTLKKTEKEIEKKAKRALAIEEARQKIRDYQTQRAQTAIGLEELFSDPKEMLEFAHHTVEQYKALIFFCSEHKLQPEQTLTEFMGSKEHYLKTGEEGRVQDLDVYIGSRIESGLKRRKVEEETQRLQKKLDNYIANFKCSRCGANIEGFGVAYNQLLCKNCAAFYSVPCPKCGTRLLFNIDGYRVTEYNCPICKVRLRANYALRNIG